MATVFISGPCTRGDTAVNIRLAVDVADELLWKGFFPFVPHLSHFWHLIYPHGYETWMALCLAWVAKSDAVLRLPGVSPGADREVAEATRLGIPVFTTVDELVAHFRTVAA